MRRALGWLLIVVVLGTAGVAVGMRTLGHDPARWHVDPASAERTGRPNDYLVAPAGMTAAIPDRIASVHATDPRALLFQFDAVARPARSVEVVAGSLDALTITYVQRSQVFGFPDYITVRAVAVAGGAALIVWSRSRVGYNDIGVNRDRVDGWLAQIGAARD